MPAESDSKLPLIIPPTSKNTPSFVTFSAVDLFLTEIAPTKDKIPPTKANRITIIAVMPKTNLADAISPLVV